VTADAGAGRRGRLAGAIVPAAAAAVAFAACLRRISDPDYWTHLALGRAFVAAGTVRIAEPFLAGSPSAPASGGSLLALPESWGFQVALYALRSATGDAGVSIAVALLAATVAALLSLAGGAPATAGPADRSGEGHPARPAVPPSRSPARGALILALVVGAIGVARFRFVPRPEVPADVLLAAALVLAAWWARAPRPALLVALAAAIALWIPVHPTWALGAALAVAHLALLPPPGTWRARLARHPRLLPAAAAGALLLATVPAARFALRVLAAWRSGQISGITEMLPTWEFPEIAWPLAGYSALAGALAWGAPAGRWRRLALLAVAIAPGVAVVRNAAFSAIAAVPAAAAGLASRASIPSVPPRPWRTRAAIGLAAAVCALLLGGALRDRDPPPGLGVDWSVFPRDAAAFVRDAHLPEPIFDFLDLGGYLDFAWNGAPRTWLDGRVGSPQRVADHDAFVSAADPEGVLARNGFRTLVVQALYTYDGAPVQVVPWLLSRPEWKLVRASDALVFVREPLPPGVAELPRGDAWRHVLAQADLAAERGASHAGYTRAVALLQLGERPAAARAWDRAVRTEPRLAGRYAAVGAVIGAVP